MGKNSPIASRNTTYRLTKSLLKLRKSNYFSYASRANHSNHSQLHWLTKSFLKKTAYLYLWLQLTKLQKKSKKITASSQVAQKKIRVKSKKKRVFTSFKTNASPLQGWTFYDLLSVFKIPQFTKKLAKKIGKKLHLPLISAAFSTRKKTNKLHFSTHMRVALRSLLAISCLTIIYGGYIFVFKDLPNPNDLTQNKQNVTTRILSRNHKVLYKIYKDENRTLVKLDDIPEDLIHATIAIEDKDFYYHHGFSIQGILRAMIANSQHDEIQQGGSTITQQLVKNRLLNSDKTIQRKLRELVLSIMVELKFSKDQILEMYLNQVAYGGSTYGAEEAAQRYFGKSVTKLNLAESSLLAGLPAAPSAYSPFGSAPELSKNRQHEVLRRMVDDGYISQTQADAAYNQSLALKHDAVDIQAPHFVFYVKKLLAQQYGEEIVNQGGLEVTTTLDLNIQNAAQKIVTTEVNTLARMRVSNGAALVTHPKTGEVLAMVGSKDYFDFEHDGQVNVTTRPRQPGSSIKPLTYALAFANGKSPSSIVDDSPITYHSAGSPPYSPKNYDGKFHGKVTMRQALASSYNIPAVKTLAEVGVSNMLDKAKLMGIDTWQDRSRFGLSLTLGGGEVLMTDMAELYSTFANYGQTVELNPILEVKNYKGEVLYRNTCALDHKGCPQNQTLDKKVAYYISDVLSDNKARTPAFGPRSVLYIPNQQVAVKTGTTNNLRDNWAIGYTTDYLAAVWVGNNNNRPMSYVASGITGASPIWNKIIRLLLDDKHPHRFPIPDGLTKVKICATTGTLPCRGCPVIKDELFTPGTEPTQACSPSWFVKKEKIDKNGDKILDGIISH